MDDELTVRCAGWEVSATEESTIAARVEHGQRLHDMRATREQILAMAALSVPPAVAGDPTAPRTPSRA